MGRNYEKTLEYGQKTLDSCLQLEKSFGPKVDVLDVMCESSSKLGRYQEASKYAKEILKIQIVRYNGGIQKDLKYLVKGLFRLVFHEECIYWSHKFLETLRI